MRLPVQTYQLRDTPASTSTLVNCYLEDLPKDARAPYLIRRTPGITNFVTTSGANGPTRAMIKSPFENTIITVNILGSRVSMNSYDINQPLGSGSEGLFFDSVDPNARVDIDKNADTLTVLVEPHAYTSTGSSFTKISDTDYTSRGGGDVEFLDNFMLFREPNSGRYFGADIGSATSFSGLNFRSAEASPDNLTGMKSDHSVLTLFGEHTMEIHDTTGSTGFPFRPVINGSIEKGCTNGKTITLIDDRIVWVADDKTVRMLNGLTPQKISTFAIDQILQDDGSLSAAVGYGYSFDGHNNYVLRSDRNCLVYDMTTRLWHRRRTIGQDSWRWGCSAPYSDKVWLGDVVGEGSSGYYLGYFDNDVFTEAGETQLMQWTYQPVYGAGQRAFHKRLEVVMRMGKTADVELNMEYSDDGGETWDFLPHRQTGASGARFARVFWNNLGASYQRVYRGSISGQRPVAITDTLLDVTGGRV